MFQRLDGHRWSLDDLVTAWVALRGAGSVHRALDLGCGIGSVLMMVAWGLPSARVLGVEAQDLSFGLCRRSLAYNGLQDRVEVRHGDLRDPELVTESGFDLVTGTPPYFDVRDGVVSDMPQKGPCRFETRGGVEAYCEAAARTLADGGRFVVCEDARQAARVLEAAAATGLHVHTQLDVIPKEGKPPLFAVFELGRSPGELERGTLTVRDRGDRRTPEFRALRRRMGIPE